MFSSRIARAVAAGTLVLAAPMLSSCGFNFATDQVYTPAPGANNRDHAVDVLNAVIVATEDGEGTLVFGLSNNSVTEADELTGVTAETFSGSPVRVNLKAPVEIKPGGYTRLATPTDDNGLGADTDVDGPGLKVRGDFKLSDFVKIDFEFANSEPVHIQAPVMPNNGDWAGQDGDTHTPEDELLSGSH